MKEALFYREIDAEKKTVQCELCPHNCKLSTGKTGICRCRQNIDGKLTSLSYNTVISVNLDPVEKKPLYHFFPGKKVLSLGTFGCNFRCSFCQNWDISQVDYDKAQLQQMAPEEALLLNEKYKSIGIAYTYNEPLINYEWVLETSRLVNKSGYKNVLVTNGFINKEPLMKLLPYIDAANIDVKSFNSGFYKKICSGNLESVLKTVELMVNKGKHVELTYLVIPEHNDFIPEVEAFLGWVNSMNPEIPVHFSRYYPQYRFNEPATPMATLKGIYEIAGKKLKYVYLGNVTESEINSTYCPGCGSVLIKRTGYDTEITGMAEGFKCNKCNCRINIANSKN